jgi:hypothetical protein
MARTARHEESEMHTTFAPTGQSTVRFAKQFQRENLRAVDSAPLTGPRRSGRVRAALAARFAVRRTQRTATRPALAPDGR